MAATVRRTDTGGEGEVLVGRRPAPAPVPRAKLKMEPIHNFEFHAHPSAWDVAVVDGVASIIPRLRQFHFEPGIACVEPVRNQVDGDPSRARQLLEQKGWRVVPRDREVVAWDQKWDDYAQEWEGYKGPVHLSVWHRPLIRGGQVVVDFDEEGWHRFLVGLVTEGVIPGPDRMVRRALESEFRTALRRYQTSAERSATAVGHAESYEQKIAAFRVLPGGKPPKAEKDQLRSRKPGTPTPTDDSQE